MKSLVESPEIRNVPETESGLTIPYRSNENERPVIAALLYEFPKQPLPEAIKILLRQAPESFDDTRLGTLALAIREMSLMEDLVCPTTVKEWLEKHGKTEEAGGVLYIDQLKYDVLSLDIVELEAKKVLQGYQNRKLTAVLSESLKTAVDAPTKTLSIAEHVVSALTELAADGTGSRKLSIRNPNEILAMQFDDSDIILGDRLLAKGQSLTN
ncbi:MAG: hypothetical protein FJ398_15140 [Verrucomicrobia bacterium]|nr:hypothetical protein [Verrucomicrobiota bacterium]